MANPVSPKVTASAVAGVIAAALLANVSLITPDLFNGLGKWSGLVYGLVIAITVSVAGYVKNDPLRVVPAPQEAAQAPAAQLVDPTPAPAPELVVPEVAPTAEPL